MLMWQGNVAVLKRGRGEHCCAGIGHQKGGLKREAGPGGVWGMGWMPVENMPGRPPFHQLFKQERSDHGALLFDHTLSLRRAQIQPLPKRRDYPDHRVQSAVVSVSVSQRRQSSAVPQGMVLGLVGAG